MNLCLNDLFVCLVSNTRYSERTYCLGDRKAVKGITTASKKVNKSSDVLTDKDLSHLLWWKEVVFLDVIGITIDD